MVDTAMLDWWLRGFGDAVWDVEREPVAVLDAPAQNAPAENPAFFLELDEHRHANHC